MTRIPVVYSKNTGEANTGFLTYHRTGPILKLEDGSEITDLDGITFKLDSVENLPDSMRAFSDFKIVLIPETVEVLGYSKDVTNPIDIYPPSSQDWLSHVVNHGPKAIFTIQDVPSRNRKLLTVVGFDDETLIDAYLIHQYESSILSMKRDYSVYSELFSQESIDSEIFSLLQKSSPSWSTLSKLVEGITIPNLTRKETAEETLDPLVPNSFPEITRKQILAFLAWLEEAEIPKEDPLEFSRKHKSASAFRALVWGHLRCMIDGVEPPQYVRIMALAERGQLQLIQRPRVEIVEQNPWNLVRLKLNELYPDWTGRVVNYAMNLANQGRVVTSLPVSKAQGTKSKKAWSDRFAMDNHGLFMRGHIHKDALGLVPIIYFGSAHRWPHKHLEWSARLSYETEKSPYLQVMIMPSSAIERVSRIMPSTRIINWEMSSVNLSLYDEKRKRWRINSSLISKSLERRRSIKQLKNEFGYWKRKQPIRLSKLQARILDLISWGMYLGGLESKRYYDYYGIDNQTIEQVLSDLLEENVFILQYLLIFENLKSINLLAQGPSNHIYSLSRAFLKHSPSSQIRIAEEGEFCIITSRVPENDVHHLLTTLARMAPENDVNLRALPITSYAGYRNNLYQRLWKDVGVWDDDISGLITQSRQRSKADN